MENRRKFLKLVGGTGALSIGAVNAVSAKSANGSSSKATAREHPEISVINKNPESGHDIQLEIHSLGSNLTTPLTKSVQIGNASELKSPSQAIKPVKKQLNSGLETGGVYKFTATLENGSSTTLQYGIPDGGIPDYAGIVIEISRDDLDMSYYEI